MGFRVITSQVAKFHKSPDSQTSPVYQGRSSIKLKSTVTRSGQVTVASLSASSASTREASVIKAGPKSDKIIEFVGQDLDMAQTWLQ